MATHKLNITVTGEQIDAIMEQAMQGCIHWCDEVREYGPTPKGAKWISQNISRGGILQLHDVETEKWERLTLTKFLKGLQAVVEAKGANFDDWDMYDADTVIQFALFGKGMYA